MFKKKKCSALDEHAQAIFDEQIRESHIKIDRMFSHLLITQWIAGIIISITISPLAWAGKSSYLHPHVWFAIAFGALITLPALQFIYMYPGKPFTRQIVAICQILFSVLLIHLTGGRIETHFHIFGSLAFLAFYRDWKVICTATAMVLIDHIIRGIYIPESVYGVLVSNPWRSIEHAVWVVFEDIILFNSCSRGLAELKEVSFQRARIEETNSQIQELAELRASKLASSEQKLSTVMDTVLDAFIMTDANGTITSWNKQAESIFGWKGEDAINSNLATFISLPPHTVTGYSRVATLMMDENRHFAKKRTELTAFHKNGSEVPIEITLTPHALDDTFIFSAFIRDITDRRKSEMTAKQLAAIIDASEDAIIGENLDGTIYSWSPGAERMYGYSAKEMIGANTRLIVPADQIQEFDQITSRITRGESVNDYETVRVKRDGSIIEISQAVSPMKNELGVIQGISVIARDITHRKEVEKRINEFYSTVSHELRTPLTSIRGALSLVADEIVEPDSDEAKEMIRIARSSSERLVTIINDILDLRKIEAGKLELRLERVEAQSLVTRGIEFMDGMARTAKVNLSSSVESNLHFFADPSRLLQVLTNLLSNAIKYSEEGDLINITVEQNEFGNARFSITDEGPGIPVEHQHKLFEKFQQIDSSDTRPKEGTGLGLAICKAIVSQHNGEIGMHSLPGLGTTFWFELPLLKEDSVMQDLEKLNDQKLVVIVEDDQNLIQFLKLRLQKDGYATRHATSKSQAMQLLSKCKPDVLLMDISLPDGSGLEIIESIRKDEKLSDIPVIIMTGRNVEDLECSPPVVFDWFIKPFDQSILIRSVERATVDIPQRRVLVIEDDPDTRAVIVAQLKKLHAHCLEAANGIQALSIARSSKPDVIILDVGIPQMDGFKFVESLYNSETNKYLAPLIVYSGEEFTEADRRKLTLGITRHLTKGRVTPDEFVSAVRELLDTVTSPTISSEPIDNLKLA
ncbi:MAG: PAS domain S-box protein [Candidatus Melainabacteria bacterium]|nr:MAG: PAS domain S-box protein [Candidatus Melainabacteria bacterium]